MVTDPACLAGYRDAKVLITGHTGFKGAWLALLLRQLGATVYGFALPPEDGEASLFHFAAVEKGMVSIIGDLRDRQAVAGALKNGNPDIVFHLAAQSLVRRSYEQPLETYATNVMGTAHVLEEARKSPSLKAVVVITSDKCYRNLEHHKGYREDDPMGGVDPYSSSKGCAELVIDAYRRSFFSADGSSLIASARAGNVIGGGDWCQDRLVPDIARAIASETPVILRNPDATRPWQHVFEPLRGYLMLGLRLINAENEFAEGWNFGPDKCDAISVGDLAEKIVSYWGKGEIRRQPDADAPHEAGILTLDIEKVRSRLGYNPTLGIDAAIGLSVDWYRAHMANPSGAALLCQNQIDSYLERIS
ncbi:MAG TPA: CDP-glucose 4,6-dehydratase [Rhodospirillales bacterium]|nr:CDP-glucose 4,6-dehydratase [Rhodospirillales bacterium]